MVPGEAAVTLLASVGPTVAATSVTNRVGAAVGLRDALGQAALLFEERVAHGGRLLFVGNGGSAGIASHQAVDFWKNGRLRASAFNDASLITCIANDYGYDQVFAEPVRRLGLAGDVLVAISSSGRSANILNAVAAGREVGCAVVTLSGFEPSNPLRATGDWNFFVPSRSYGVVEISHLAILHAVLEDSMCRRGLADGGARAGKQA